MFDQLEYANEFDSVGMTMVYSLGHTSLPEEVREFRREFERKIEFLDGLAERIELIDLAPGVSEVAAPSVGETKRPASGTKVFLVHGRDDEMKAVVARFIERCGLQPIVLHEQVDQGRTIIEKFEQESDVGFAVVLLSPDDVGGLLTDPQEPKAMRPRARQNVVLELGYFVGKLTRNRVCALKRGEIELPSDFSGVLYTPFGADEGWKIKLARELKSAGYDVDMNQALG